MKKSKDLKALFNKRGIVYIVGAHDGLSAKLVEANGFDGVWASGLEISTSFAVPDANILTMSQYLERACEMNDAVSLPVVADCDTGYGNSNNVMHMVRKYESAGIAAVCIEDKRFPKINSLLPGARQELATVNEFTGKITAAKSVQASEDFMVIARVEALIAGLGEKEALLRAEKYVEAGADAILIHSKSDRPDEIISFARKWGKKAPLVIVPTTYPSIMSDLSHDELEDLGIKMVIFANHGLRASIRAMDETFAEIRRSGGLHTVEKRIATLDEVFSLQGMVRMREEEKKHLKSEHEDVVVLIPAAGRPDKQESIEPLLKEGPPCMVDIAGRPLLDRNLDTLRDVGVKDINVIAGYKKERIIEGFGSKDVGIIINNEFEAKHILHSVMLAQDKMKDKTLIVFSDILFNRSLIDKVLRSKEDILLVGDNTYKKYGERNKKLDLINVSEPMVAGRREIITDQLFSVSHIGKELDKEAADFEFVGISYFSREGIRAFRDLYDKRKRSLDGKAEGFHEAGNFDQASLTDLLQEAVDSGLSVKLLSVNAGWMEIHEARDHELACASVKE